MIDPWHFSEEMLRSSADYERIRTVGKGSFGSAILYSRKADKQLVILKEINLFELSSSDRKLALNEVALLSKLSHPHIISYHSSFEENGVLMIEMEYADGGSLKEFLEDRKEHLEEKLVMRMFGEMVRAVNYLHKNDVLHRGRGMKPKLQLYLFRPKNREHLPHPPQRHKGRRLRYLQADGHADEVQRRADLPRHPLLPEPGDVRGPTIQRKERHLGSRDHTLRDG